MESWRKVWREGFAPLLNKAQLASVLEALEKDDPRLIQGATTTPPPLQSVQDWPVEACCVSAFFGVDDLGGFGVATVGEVEEFFARLCYECDRLLGEPAGVRWFLCWVDDTPRDEMRHELAAEVRRSLENLAALEGLEVPGGQ